MPRSYRLKIQKASDVQKPRSIVADGLLVAGGTAVAYLVTFAYEYGYCSYFGIPGFLIEPSTGTILFAATCILTAGVFLVDLTYLPRELLAAIPWPGLRNRLVLVAFIWLTPALMSLPYEWFRLLNLCFWTFLVLGSYIIALLFNKGSFAERILQGEKDALSSTSSWDGLHKKFGAKVVGSVLLGLWAMIFALLIGSMQARLQVGFTVLKSAPDTAVIKRYGDRLVAIRYEGSSPRATGDFRVIDREKDMDFISMEKLKIDSVRKKDSGNDAKN